MKSFTDYQQENGQPESEINVIINSLIFCTEFKELSFQIKGYVKVHTLKFSNYIVL
jgi:hypothetical protein